MHTPTDIGIFEAKTRLSELLRRTQTGESFRITQRGIPVAELTPIGSAKRMSAQEAAAKLRAFMDRQPPANDIDTKALIEKGRK